MQQFPHARDLRKGRRSEPGYIYLITTVTHQRRGWFSDWRYGHILAQTLYREQDNAETLAYVVMPDHLHWLIRLQHDAFLDAIMRTVKSISSRRINALHSEPGRIWQHGYHDHALRREEDLVATARYIVANPLRAGLVRRLGDYPLWNAIWI